MPTFDLDLTPYALGDAQIENLASEFFACVDFPTGSGPHTEATLVFLNHSHVPAAFLFRDFLRALESFRRPLERAA